MKIALDVDGVLADVITSWLNYSNTIRPKISKHDITDWDFWKKFQINRYDFYAELSSCWKNWNSIPPTEENLSTVTKNLSKITISKKSCFLQGNWRNGHQSSPETGTALLHKYVSETLCEVGGRPITNLEL